MYIGAAAEQHSVAGALARVARSMDAGTDFDSTMRTMVASAVATVPGAESVGITRVRRRRQELEVEFASDDFVVRLDRSQYDAGEGPCLDAAYEHRTVRVEDFRGETRWPRFAPRAVELGARSLLSVQLFVEEENLAALNMYARRPRAFDDESEQVGLLFAAHAGIAMAGARRDAQMRAALDSRDLIAQAKGVIMERYSLGPITAFQLLTRLSQDANQKLRNVALQVLDDKRFEDRAHADG